MRLVRQIPDFTAIARSSLYSALTIRPEIGPPVRRDDWTARATFIAHLSTGMSLRAAARCAGLDRRQAKDVLRIVSRAAADCQAMWAARQSGRGCRHFSAWAFAAKAHAFPPSHLDRDGVSSVWTHAWAEEGSGFVHRWCVGPSPSRLSCESQSSAGERETARAWLESMPSGFPKRIEQHAQAVSFFALHHNFCAVGARGGTPAMLSGLSDRIWTARDLESMAFGLEAEGAV